MQDDINNMNANTPEELTETAGTIPVREDENIVPTAANVETTQDAGFIACEPEPAPGAEKETVKDPPPPEIPANCKLVGVRFKTAGELYYVPDENMTFALHERVVVKLAKGKDIAEIALLNPLAGTKVNDPHVRIIRRVNESDVAQEERNRQREKEAFAICNNKIKKLELPMKLLKVQYIFDGSRVTFFFKADSKVDFRKLVRELAFVFRTRIELRQIGPRDETEMLGGLGICGRRICCNYWPCRTKAVINVDTQKNPFLNVIGMQSKVSGLCSRPLCCLRYEGEAEACKLQVPSVNAKIIIDEQVGILKTIDEKANQVAVEIEGEEVALNLSYEDFLLKIQEGKVKPFKEYKPKPDLPFLKKDNVDNKQDKTPSDNKEGQPQQPRDRDASRDNRPRENRDNRDGRNQRDNRPPRPAGPNDGKPKEFKSSDNRGRDNRDGNRGRDSRDNKGDNRDNRGKDNRDKNTGGQHNTLQPAAPKPQPQPQAQAPKNEAVPQTPAPETNAGGNEIKSN